jgi:hypothetical protein
MNLPADFQLFYELIELGDRQAQRINSAAGTLRAYLLRYYSLHEEDVFLQGSYPNGTAIKPDPEDENGEYDVDLISVSAAAGASPDEALKDLEDALSKDGNYEKQIERENPKTPCVRLRYADDEIGGFHVDVTPARPCNGEASLEIPRRGVGWQPTSPAEYTQWCRDQGTDFARLVQMLKRWRDHHQDARRAVRSIVLQVLVAENRVWGGDDARSVAGTLRAISQALAKSPLSPPKILNPVLRSENLAERWPDADYRNFRSVVDKAATLAEKALNEPGLNESRILWRELFGRDFPPPEEPGPYSRPVSQQVRTRAQQAPPRVEWG